MGNLADPQRMGGEGFHIGDCYVWAEIYYLDSPTDYREYLPQDGADGPCPASHNDWVLLEPSKGSRAKVAKPLSASMVFLFVLLVSGLVSYGVFEVLQAAAVRINTVAG